MTLAPEDIKLIADAVADKILSRLETGHLLRPPQQYLDAAQLAQKIGMSTAWVYRNKDLLGAERRGTGPKARLRFDLETARARLAAEQGPAQRTPSGPSRAPGRAPRLAYSGPLLPIKGLTQTPAAGTVDPTAKRPGGADTPRAMAPRSKP